MAKRKQASQHGDSTPTKITSPNFPSPSKEEFVEHDPATFKKVPASFWAQDCADLASALLNKILVRVVDGRTLAARIVETEAYLGGADLASHSAGGRQTPRTAAMFMAPGTAYVYNIYGMYQCVNVSSRGAGAAVLLRAAQPLTGLKAMEARRKKNKLKDLCSGPSKLCQALAIDMGHNTADLTTDPNFYFAESPLYPNVCVEDIVTSARIGIGKSAGEWRNAELRYVINGDNFVSVK